MVDISAHSLCCFLKYFYVTCDCNKVPKIAQNEYSEENLIRRNELVGLISPWKGSGRVWCDGTRGGCGNDEVLSGAVRGVVSLSHRAARAGEMKSFPRLSSPLSRLFSEGQPTGVRGSLFLGVCAVPEDACRALISADSSSDTGTSPCEAPAAPEEQLSDLLSILWGFVVPVAVSCWCHLHWLCAVPA